MEDRKTEEDSLKNGVACGQSEASCSVAVPMQDIINLEKARLELIRMLEATEMLNMANMMSVTNPMWKITHTKYKPILRGEGRVSIKSPELICPECGHYPLTLEGTKTLSMPKDKKSYCDECSYETRL